MAAVSVIVPVRDAAATLPRTLDALAGQEFEGDYEVIVVDDGSRDDSAAAAARGPGPVRLLRQAPSGPAAARNLGVRHARSPLLAFCDADVFPTERWLAEGAAALAEADLVQGRVVPDPAAALGPFDRTIWVNSAAGLFETASLFVRRELFDRLGGFEEWLRPPRGKALAEDVWFGYRAVRAGARTGFCAEALAYHAVFPRSWRAYVTERERLRYFPAMAATMPELRARFFYRHLFLNRRSACFDLALLGLGTTLLSRRPAPLLATVPYLRTLRAGARRHAGPAPAPVAVAGADAAADVVGLGAMLLGSVRYRSPVL